MLLALYTMAVKEKKAKSLIWVRSAPFVLGKSVSPIEKSVSPKKKVCPPDLSDTIFGHRVQILPIRRHIPRPTQNLVRARECVPVCPQKLRKGKELADGVEGGNNSFSRNGHDGIQAR